MSNLYTQIDMLRQERDEARADRDALTQKLAQMTDAHAAALKRQHERDFDGWMATLRGPPITHPATEGQAAIAERDARIRLAAEEEARADFDALGNIVMAMAFDRERENEHNRTHSECAFCREETGRNAKSMTSHMFVCGLHPAHALMSAAKLVRDGEFGPLPLAALAKLNEAIIEASP